MALRLQHTADAGITFDAYARVRSFVGSKRGFRIDVEFYLFGTSYDEMRPVEHKVFMVPFDPDPQPQVSNAVARTYEVLKSLPEFADAVDV